LPDCIAVLAGLNIRADMLALSFLPALSRFARDRYRKKSSGWSE
jgi:hypothetical protein